MGIEVPKVRKHLCADALLRSVQDVFCQMPDHRKGDPDIPLSDALMSAIPAYSEYSMEPMSEGPLGIMCCAPCSVLDATGTAKIDARHAGHFFLVSGEAALCPGHPTCRVPMAPNNGERFGVEG